MNEPSITTYSPYSYRFQFLEMFRPLSGNHQRDIHKRMVLFQKLIKIYFSPCTDTTYIASKQRELSKFLCPASSSLLMLTAGPWDPFSRWCRRRRLSVFSVLRCPDLWLQCRVSFVHGLKKTRYTRIMSWFPSRAENFAFTSTSKPVLTLCQIYILSWQGIKRPDREANHYPTFSA
jgi:hypothetical protein